VPHGGVKKIWESICEDVNQYSGSKAILQIKTAQKMLQTLFDEIEPIVEEGESRTGSGTVTMDL
jgi:hypothetical protein